MARSGFEFFEVFPLINIYILHFNSFSFLFVTGIWSSNDQKNLVLCIERGCVEKSKSYSIISKSRKFLNIILKTFRWVCVTFCTLYLDNSHLFVVRIETVLFEPRSNVSVKSRWFYLSSKCSYLYCNWKSPFVLVIEQLIFIYKK